MQREVVYMKDHGHLVVLGTAGSGKTTMAIHRAVYLASVAPQSKGRTLLVTFNRALATYLRAGAKVPGLTVENFHTFARGYLGFRGLLRGRQICEAASFLPTALNEVRRRNPDQPLLRRSPRFFEDELHWITGHGANDLDTYNRTARVGRLRPLSQADKALVFQIRDVYHQLRQQQGYRYDWDDLASAVHQELTQDNGPRLYKHIVVDEGQDFTPEMIRALAAAVPPDGSLTFFGDYAQQMYGSRMSWRSLGLQVSRPVEFQHNYRNTQQIARLAVAMSEMPHFRDDVDLVVPKAPRADGPKPTVWVHSSPTAQLRAAAKWARDLRSSHRVAILLRTRDEEKKLSKLLGEPATRLHKNMAGWPTGSGVFYGTYHAAKGLEFDAVLLPWCDADQLPHPTEVEGHGQQEASAREARLLYVAVTRARTNLILLHSSKLTTLLPQETSDLYERVGA
ncbi:3'-5' exonuclease [Spirillospora sp. NPDC029432]|uniref:3'-5' exonuclease n=1 Tax=Spirillospora sp. NPDC029432 TaxID=3154599 RepID=UPI003452EA1D